MIQPPAGHNLQEVAQLICTVSGFGFVKRVGGGSFKETFQVLDSSGTPRALKVIRQSNSLERLKREIEAMARCVHPNIAYLSSVDVIAYQNREYLYLTEEYMEGGTLAQRLKVGTITIDEVVQLGRALISTVAHIASLDLVHRDLKPDNIMFRGDGVSPVVIDFGIVRDLSQPSLTKDWLQRGPGTPFYSAPEQLENSKALIDWRTDQFALGVLLTECAIGHHPYFRAGDDHESVVQRVASRELPSDQFRQEIQRSRLWPLEKMVAPWPVQRFRTPEELRRAWERRDPK